MREELKLTFLRTFRLGKPPPRNPMALFGASTFLYLYQEYMIHISFSTHLGDDNEIIDFDAKLKKLTFVRNF